jgi:AhpD family alkylhydroperoxidase
MTDGRLAPWLVELAGSIPGLVRSYLPGGPVDARTRERVILAVTEVNGCRWCAWVHGAWADYLGEGVEDPAEAEEALLDYARACAEAGQPLDTTALAAVLPPTAVGAVRATVAQIGVASVVGRRADGLLARLSGRRRLDPWAAAAEVATVALALPVAAPVLATAGAMRLATRLAPPMPAIEEPEGDDANLLVHLLARTVPAYLANAGVRLALLRLPVVVSIGVRTGRSAATLRIGRGRVEVANGVGSDALVVLEGDVEPLLQVATGSLVRELAGLRLKRD